MEKTFPVAEASEKLRPGRLSSVSVMPRISPEDVSKMSADELLVALRLSYPEYDADWALTYFDGGMMACRMMGMENESVIHFIGAWSSRDEYMLVGSLYANVRGLKAQAKKVVIASAAPGVTH